jgi:hypothetical protein
MSFLTILPTSRWSSNYEYGETESGRKEERKKGREGRREGGIKGGGRTDGF